MDAMLITQTEANGRTVIPYLATARPCRARIETVITTPAKLELTTPRMGGIIEPWSTSTSLGNHAT